MPVTTVRAKLRATLSKKLVPVLIAKGFRGPSDLEGNSLVHEYRRSTDQGTQVLEIQFEKRQLPRFVINLYVEPLGGVKALMVEGWWATQRSSSHIFSSPVNYVAENTAGS